MHTANIVEGPSHDFSIKIHIQWQFRYAPEHEKSDRYNILELTMSAALLCHMRKFRSNGQLSNYIDTNSPSSYLKYD